MKLALAIAGDNARPDAFVVFRGFEHSIRRAAELGYRGVELALKSSDEIEPDRLEVLLKQHRLGVSCISTGQVYADTGLSLTDDDPERRRRAIEVMQGMVDLAAHFGHMVNIGRVRGGLNGRDVETVNRLFIETVKPLADYAATKNVNLALEPVNRYEIDFLNSVEEAAALVRGSGIRNLLLMPDVFHMNIEDRDMGRTLADHIDRIGYIHLADSNRLAPGQGHLDFTDIFGNLRAEDYTGWLGVEILPQPDPDTAARQAAEFLLPILEDS